MKKLVALRPQLVALAVVLVMALVTLATRWGGVFVMAFVPIGDRVRQFITAMSGSVLVAIVAPMALQGDAGARLALLATAATNWADRCCSPAIRSAMISGAASVSGT